MSKCSKYISKNITQKLDILRYSGSHRDAITDLAIDFLEIGVPSTRCVDVAHEVFKRFLECTSTHVSLATSGKGLLHAKEALTLWQSPAARDIVRRATQSYITRIERSK